MRLLARRAREELNAVGARPRRSALSGPGALTPAEHRVAAAGRRGHSNRAIAERLYVTQRTVETHLTHVFQKLDIRSRAELAPRSSRGPRRPGPRWPAERRSRVRWPVAAARLEARPVRMVSQPG